MTQATGGFSATDAKVEISANGSSWTDISGWANSVKPGKGSRNSGARWTHDGDSAILTAGKRQPITVDCSIIMTEGTGDPFEVLRAAFEAAGGTSYYLRWSPKGGGAGEFQYSTGAAIIKNFEYPGTDTEDAKPVAVTFTIETASITKSAVAT